MINYQTLHIASNYYQNQGYKRIEAPWTVTKKVADITKPEDTSHWTIKEKNKVLVASGEQSFLYLYLKGFLPLGKFSTITPCFRDESFDFLHTKYFMKLELIDTEYVHSNNLDYMINTARLFFQQYFTQKIEQEQTDENAYDLFVSGIDPNGNPVIYELGSYGIRHCEYLSWIYGTGVAEPRFSGVLKSLNQIEE